MTLVHSSRCSARVGTARFVPGSLACAATARHYLFQPTPLQLSTRLKRVTGVLTTKTVTRLASE